MNKKAQTFDIHVNYGTIDGFGVIRNLRTKIFQGLKKKKDGKQQMVKKIDYHQRKQLDYIHKLDCKKVPKLINIL